VWMIYQDGSHVVGEVQYVRAFAYFGRSTSPAKDGVKSS
jgi:hypothetical protein